MKVIVSNYICFNVSIPYNLNFIISQFLGWMWRNWSFDKVTCRTRQCWYVCSLVPRQGQLLVDISIFLILPLVHGADSTMYITQRKNRPKIISATHKFGLNHKFQEKIFHSPFTPGGYMTLICVMGFLY